MKPFDLAVITARDERQQRLFEQRLDAMSLDAWTRDLLVVADPPGPQPGSGGSTLYALAAARDHLGLHLAPVEAFQNRRIVLVHCGGLSQRIPQFAALGKAFAPIEPGQDGRTVIEAVLESLASLAEAMPGGVLVACGDVLFRGSPPEAFPPTAAAWAWPAPLEQASRHGIFQWDPETGRATATLQKPSVAKLRELGWGETAPLDTGVLFLPPSLLTRLFHTVTAPGPAPLAARVLDTRDHWQGLDLYGQLVPAFVAPAPFAPYPWLESLGGCGLQVCCPPDGDFLHFGTTAELLAILSPTDASEPALINTAANGGTLDAEAGSALVHCRIEAPLHAGEGSFLLGLNLCHGETRIDPQRLVFSLPVSSGNDTCINPSADPGRIRSEAPRESSKQAPGVPLSAAERVPGGEVSPPYPPPPRSPSEIPPSCDVVIALGVDDDPKAGSTARLMHQPLSEWAAQRGLLSADLWGDEIPEGARTLWNARLFPVGTQADLNARLAWLQKAAGVGAWPRISLAEAQQRFDGDRWSQYEASLRAERNA